MAADRLASKPVSLNISLIKANSSGLDIRKFYNNTALYKQELESVVLYKAENGRGIIRVWKTYKSLYMARGQFCKGSIKVTIKDAELGFDLRNLQQSVLSPFKLSSCHEISSPKFPSIPSYSFPQIKRVSVNQRYKRYVRRHPKSRHVLKRSPIDLYTVELLIVIDFEAFTRWKRLFSHDTSQTATENIKQYYSYVFNGIDLRFGTIEKQSFEINIGFSGFVIAKTEDESFWTSTSTIEDQVLSNNKLMINASEALEKFQDWLDNEEGMLPQYDHAILITGGDLTYAGNTGNTGLAFAESMCRNISNSSIVEEAFDFRTVTYATRQIARSLGARDDMDNNDCLEFFNFIMAPKFKLPVKSFPTNRWKFSTCSIQYFKDYLSKINEDGLNCLKETSPVDRYPPEVITIIQELPGTIYSAKIQCQNVYGKRSDICRARLQPSDYEKLCSGLLCTKPGSDECGYVLPADGTPCGNMKYCFEGQCLEFDDAEKGVDNCVFGDDPAGKCRKRISNKPFLCYKDTERYSCCASCAKVNIGLPGCEYGDRKKYCRPKDCVNDTNSDTNTVCCLTCADGPVPSMPPTGDWFLPSTYTDNQSPMISVDQTTTPIELSAEASVREDTSQSIFTASPTLPILSSETTSHEKLTTSTINNIPLETFVDYSTSTIPVIQTSDRQMGSTEDKTVEPSSSPPLSSSGELTLPSTKSTSLSSYLEITTPKPVSVSTPREQETTNKSTRISNPTLKSTFSRFYWTTRTNSLPTTYEYISTSLTPKYSTSRKISTITSAEIGVTTTEASTSKALPTSVSKGTTATERPATFTPLNTTIQATENKTRNTAPPCAKNETTTTSVLQTSKPALSPETLPNIPVRDCTQICRRLEKTATNYGTVIIYLKSQ